MRSTAHVQNSHGENRVEVSTGEHSLSLSIPSKPSGFGSRVGGGEMLMLALATCYCNDVYREARNMGIDISRVEVECGAEFPAEGAPASEITYTTKIVGHASADQVRELAARADQLAEIHNTVRTAIPVRLSRVDMETD
jgi:organic hydroperoxide reductase OsmC/OhrA